MGATFEEGLVGVHYESALFGGGGVAGQAVVAEDGEDVLEVGNGGKGRAKGKVQKAKCKGEGGAGAPSTFALCTLHFAF